MSYTEHLTPEERMKRIVEILADAALRLHRKQAAQRVSEPVIAGLRPSQSEPPVVKRSSQKPTVF